MNDPDLMTFVLTRYHDEVISIPLDRKRMVNIEAVEVLALKESLLTNHQAS